jgi:cytochrome c553
MTSWVRCGWKLKVRKGEWTPLMMPVVEKLSAEDMLDLAAFAAPHMP